MNKDIILNKLKEKLVLYEELKNKIGYNEELLKNLDGLSENLINKEVLEKFPPITERKLFNNTYLKECIKQLKLKIFNLENA